jgi:hypothetical protein
MDGNLIEWFGSGIDILVYADQTTHSAYVLRPSMLDSLHLAKVVEGDLAWP